MKAITRFVLRRPVTVLMCILCLIVFGTRSVLDATLELSPQMDMPMLMISTTYPGASPEDVDELVTKEIEGSIGSLSDVKSITSTSSEGRAMVRIEYNYGTDTDDAYDELKKQLDRMQNRLPEDCGSISVMAMNMNSRPSVTMVIDNPSQKDLYTYVEDKLLPEFEKISNVTDVSLRGGSNQYIRVELIREKVEQYGLTMAGIAQDITSSDLSYPSGSTDVGSLELSLSTRMKFGDWESLKDIPLTTRDGSTIYLQDVADISVGTAEVTSVSRYNGNPTVSVSITKEESSTDVALSRNVKKVVDTLLKNDPDLHITVVRDSADQIIDSLMSVVRTMILAVVISMIVIWLFFGDIKASLIIGSSIPFSILTALIMLTRMGYSLNVVTMSALTLGVGMMVDNSIVVMESCFRATERRSGGFVEYAKDALEGAGQVSFSVLGSTVTTCVVFIPLAMIKGMAGQLFTPLGLTIVFCMVASLVSAVSVVPLCYMVYRPKERGIAPFSGPVRRLQAWYRGFMPRMLKRKWLVMGVSVLLLAGAVMIGRSLGMELMASDDQGEISISVTTRPGLRVEEADKILTQVEEIISTHEDLDSWMTTFGAGMRGTSGSVSAYLKDDRKMSTAEVADQWRRELADITNCSISVEASSSMSMMSGFRNTYSAILKGTNYDDVKETVHNISAALKERDDVTRISSSIDNGAPVLEIQVDPIKAKAAGMTPASIGSAINTLVSGRNAREIDLDGESVDVKVLYPEEDYDSIDKVEGIVLTTASGGAVALTDIADIRYVESPSSITRLDKEYQVTLSAEYTDKAGPQTRAQILAEVVRPNLRNNVTIGTSSRDRSQAEEFKTLYGAIGTAVFLVFVVMAMQFESVRYSVMVMTTIPFSLIGAFGLLWLADVKISMVSLIGFLMLAGTVVNNGILFVDTANQNRAEMDLDTALVEAGATRVRPILMTTMTTVLAMVPMAMALGNAGSTTQGLAVVDIGGLTASTVLALLMLPVYYRMMSAKPMKEDPFAERTEAEEKETSDPAAEREEAVKKAEEADLPAERREAEVKEEAGPAAEREETEEKEERSGE